MLNIFRAISRAKACNIAPYANARSKKRNWYMLGLLLVAFVGLLAFFSGAMLWFVVEKRF